MMLMLRWIYGVLIPRDRLRITGFSWLKNKPLSGCDRIGIEYANDSSTEMI
jgi:hypothetical protein